MERIRVRAREGSTEIEREDQLAVEEPLAIQFQTGASLPRTFVTTMRTPGNDEELAAGLLFAEGVLEKRRDLVSLGRPNAPAGGSDRTANVLVATLGSEAFARAERLQRGTVMGSACGVCGKTSIDNVLPAGKPPIVGQMRVPAEVLYGLPARLRENQSIFARTGGLHAAGLFSSDGKLREAREDIGRHNAADKLIGTYFLRDELPLSDSILMVSGRTGFEIVQKAFEAGIPVVASISAPSSLAVALAESTGMTLVGFLRETRYNIYSGRERISAA